jgi:hypothetical protein
MTMIDLTQNISNECSIKLLPSTDFVYCASVRPICDVVRLPLFHNYTSHTHCHVDVCLFSIGAPPSLLPSCIGPPTLHHPPKLFVCISVSRNLPKFPTVVQPRVGVGACRWVGRSADTLQQYTRGHEHRRTWPDESERPNVCRNVVRDNCWLWTGRRPNSAPNFNFFLGILYEISLCLLYVCIVKKKSPLLSSNDFITKWFSCLVINFIRIQKFSDSVLRKCFVLDINEDVLHSNAAHLTLCNRLWAHVNL